jgi:hypothetical protein
MERLDITDIVSTEPTIEFEFHDKSLDFHNDFNCTKISCDPLTRTIKFYFLSTSDYYSLTFENSEYHYVDYEDFGLSSKSGLCLDDFSKLEWKEINGQGVAFDNAGQFKYFQANFIEGLCFIVKAEKCFLVKEDFKKLLDSLDLEQKKKELRTERRELREKYEQLEINRQAGLLDSKAFLFEKQKIRKRATEINDTLGQADSFGEDFKI